MFRRMQACTSQFLQLIYRLCLTLTTKTSKHILHSQFTQYWHNTQNYAIYISLRNARPQRHRRTIQATVCLVTACHCSTDAHTHDSNDCYSLRVLLLRVCSETGEFSTTFKLHCAMRISGIAVVSSIAIPETVVIVAAISGIAQHYSWLFNKNLSSIDFPAHQTDSPTLWLFFAIALLVVFFSFLNFFT